MEPRGLPRLLMHLANGLVILFIMLPIVAVVLGSLQPEKTLQGESHRVIPSEWTFDNFTVILTQGQQKGHARSQELEEIPDDLPGAASRRPGWTVERMPRLHPTHLGERATTIFGSLPGKMERLNRGSRLCHGFFTNPRSVRDLTQGLWP